MHTEIGFWEIVFRTSLFSLLAYKLYDLIRIHVVPMLFEILRQEKKEQTELLEKEKLMHTTQTRLKQQMYNQKQMFTLLERNVLAWHKACNEASQRSKDENAAIVQKMIELRTMQQRNVMIEQVVRASIPQAIDLATRQLEARYGSDEGTVHLHTVIEQLNASGRSDRAKNG